MVHIIEAGQVGSILQLTSRLQCKFRGCNCKLCENNCLRYSRLQLVLLIIYAHSLKIYFFSVCFSTIHHFMYSVFSFVSYFTCIFISYFQLFPMKYTFRWIYLQNEIKDTSCILCFLSPKLRLISVQVFLQYSFFQIINNNIQFGNCL